MLHVIGFVLLIIGYLLAFYTVFLTVKEVIKWLKR